MMRPEESIISGGLEYPALWVRCWAAASFKPHEMLIHIQASDVTDPLPFFVDSDLVNPSDLAEGQEIESRVKVMFLEQLSGQLIVEVPGEPVSYGPKIRIGEDLIAQE